MGEPTTEHRTARARVAAFLRPRWRSLTAATLLSAILAAGAGLALHILFANAASTSPLASARWVFWTWLTLAGLWWTAALLRALQPQRRVVLSVTLAVVLAVCIGLPVGTWATYAVNHAAAKGAQFDTAAATEFFLNAFSRYREELDIEGEFKILATVDRKRRAAVLARVRAVRAVLEAPVPGETPPPGQKWNRTRFDLVMAGELPSPPGTVAFAIFSEETYPTDQWPYQATPGTVTRPGHLPSAKTQTAAGGSPTSPTPTSARPTGSATAAR